MLYFSGKGCSEFPKKVLILIGILIILGTLPILLYNDGGRRKEHERNSGMDF